MNEYNHQYHKNKFTNQLKIGNILQFLYSLKNQPGNNTEAMQCPEKGYKAFSSLHQITLMLPLIATAKTYKI